jgi:hypothetical protein
LKNKTRIISITLFFLVSILISSYGKQEAKWKGKIEKEDGVIIIQNPKEPLYSEDVFNLEEELALGGADEREEYMFSNIRYFDVSEDERIYILDSKEAHVKVFDKDGIHLMTIGRLGQGPGELNRPLMISLNQKELMIHEFGRLSFFSLDGEFMRHVSEKEVLSFNARIDSQGNIILTEGIRDPDNPRYQVKKFDSNFNLLAEIDSSPLPDPGRYNPFMAVGHWLIDKDDNIVFGYPKTYEIKIYNPSGQLIKKITKKYDPVEITEEEKKEQAEDLPPQIKEGIVFPKHHPAFYRLCLDDEGRIFVQTWEKIGEEDVYYHDVFDPEGRFITKVPIRLRPIICKKGKLYTLEEDEEGFQFVKRYKVTWKY